MEIRIGSCFLMLNYIQRDKVRFRYITLIMAIRFQMAAGVCSETHGTAEGLKPKMSCTPFTLFVDWTIKSCELFGQFSCADLVFLIFDLNKAHCNSMIESSFQ